VEIRIDDTTIELVEGDITALEMDAIVNAANERLAHGGGVAGAITRAGGPVIQEESNRWVQEHGRVATGEAVITSGGDLKADYVIHAVGPIYSSVSPSKAADLLASAVRSALEMADEHDLSSIALPAISTGIYGYPIEGAARVMLEAAVDYVKSGTGLERVVFCLYGRSAFDTFAEAFDAYVD